MSLISTTRAFNVKCEAVTAKNIEHLVTSDVAILFVWPEVLQTPIVIKSLLKVRDSFALKVIDEVHLCKHCSKDKSFQSINFLTD